MEKKEILINDKKVIIMEQPTITVLEWERKYKDNKVAYAEQILKYPSGVNESLEKLLDLPNKIEVGELKQEVTLSDIEQMYMNVIENNTVLFIAENFIKKNKKNINDYKYNQLIEVGTEIFEQIKKFGYVGLILSTFRSI